MGNDKRVAGEDEGGGLIVLNGLNFWNFRTGRAKARRVTRVRPNDV